MGLLSDVAILRHKEHGSIVIEPYNAEQLNNSSYDLTLGPWFARYRKHEQVGKEPLRLWEQNDLFDLHDSTPYGGFILRSRERVLAHTREKAGGTVANGKAVTSSLHATSTAQRLGISVCLDAGFGDVGYVQKWCLELNNHSPFDIFLPIGAVLCQVAFHEVEVPIHLYGGGALGNYAASGEWKPEMMLPKRMKVRP